MGERIDLVAAVAAILRARYEAEDPGEVTSLCAHCSDRWAENVAEVLVAGLGLREEEAVQEVAIPSRLHPFASYVAAVRKRPVPELRIVRRMVSEWVGVQP